MICPRLTGLLLAATVLAPLRATQEEPRAPAGWPCGAKVDMSYFAMAEATGGQVWLTPPDELPKTGGPLAAFWDHRQTLFRSLGPMDAPTQEFRVPVDSSVESVVFSMFVQCLQNAEVLSPSRGPGGESSDARSRAWRVLVVKRPEVGVWTIRVSGSGLVGVSAQVRTALEIAQIQFGVGGTTTLARSPRQGVENLVFIDMRGAARQVEASMVDATFRKIAPLTLTAGTREGTYQARFTPSAAPFRVLVEGKDANGIAFQRLHAPLFTPE